MKKPLKIIVIITFAVYVMIIISVTFLSGRHALHDVSITDHFISRSNLIPFRTVLSYIRAIKNNSINFDIPFKNIVGNLFLFLPMSVYLACMFKKCRFLPINLLVIFTVLSVIGLGINSLVIFICLDGIYNHVPLLQQLIGRGLAETGGKVVATAVVMVYNFITRKIFLEKKGE